MFKKLALFSLAALFVTEAAAADEDTTTRRRRRRRKVIDEDDTGLTHDKYTRFLRFKRDNVFKIVDFSDLLFDGESDDWLKTADMMERILDQEKPDLVTLTGDLVAPKRDYADGIEAAIGNALRPIKSRGIPYAWTGGNKIPNVTNQRLQEIDSESGG